MQDLYIERTLTMPEVSFKTTGEIKLEGRALPENAYAFFQPMIQWASEIDVKEINFEFNVDYFNTSVSKQLLDLFRSFENNHHIEKINITWMYEDGDEEMLESGEVYEEMLKKCHFIFQKFAEIVD